jgi:hypothetical protein
MNKDQLKRWCKDHGWYYDGPKHYPNGDVQVKVSRNGSQYQGNGRTEDIACENLWHLLESHSK